MKIISKKDLVLKDGYLCDKDDNVVSMPGLATEANEIFELIELVEFTKANEKAILASKAGEKLEFVPSNVAAKDPVITSGKKAPATPLHDKAAAEKKALADEWLKKTEHEDIDQHLARYPELARWFASTNVKVGTPASMLPFHGDIIKLTEKQVVDVITAYHDKDVRELIKLVNIRYA